MRIVQPEEQVGIDLRLALEWKTFLERGRLEGVTRDTSGSSMLLECV